MTKWVSEEGVTKLVFIKYKEGVTKYKEGAGCDQVGLCRVTKMVTKEGWRQRNTSAGAPRPARNEAPERIARVARSIQGGACNDLASAVEKKKQWNARL